MIAFKDVIISKKVEKSIKVGQLVIISSLLSR